MGESTPCISCGETAVKIGYQAKSGGIVYQCNTCGYSFLGIEKSQMPKVIFERRKEESS